MLMNKKKNILFGILLAATSLCAQPRISSNTENVNLGRVEWRIPVKVEYTITNTGNKPLVMTEVIPSCSCTIADWTKDPIEPGQKGKVVATFDAKTLGHFEKDVCIYSNAEPHLVYLNFTGEVVRDAKDVSSSNPYKIGNIAIDKTAITFPDAHQGDILTTTLNVVNQSDRPYEPILMHLPSFITMKRSADVLLKGQRGFIQLTIDTKQINDVGLLQNSIYLSRFNGDKVSPENEIPISVVLLPDFSKMTKEDLAKAPVIKMSTTTLDMSDEMSKSKIVRDITITNAGQSPLVITKMQVFNSAIGVELKNRSILPGESTVLKVTLHTKSLKDNKEKLSILIIDDDPQQPKVEVNIKTTYTR
jgi:hypothetical protein